MSKAKKTRQQKIISDLRKQLQTQPTSTTSHKPHQYSYSASTSSHRLETTKLSEVTSAHVAKDLSRTLLLTAALLFAELILFLLVRNHIVSIPMVKY
jgi:hypothetical protein